MRFRNEQNTDGRAAKTAEMTTGTALYKTETQESRGFTTQIPTSFLHIASSATVLLIVELVVVFIAIGAAVAVVVSMRQLTNP